MKYIAFSLLFLLVSCVQPTANQKVRYTVVVPKSMPVSQMAVRGSNQPLSWEQDTAMKRLNDSTFYVDVVHKTGYTYTEYKFVADGQFERQNQDNRKLTFDADLNTTVTHLFNGK